ncbi:hypothetical protein Sjap_022134 [Stephania japonica]|uniref:Uncharacterized protein n=1 Tax=Stephania japonica TaxID=461633 RepID=A0AAP0ERF0_9MAGN
MVNFEVWDDEAKLDIWNSALVHVLCKKKSWGFGESISLVFSVLSPTRELAQQIQELYTMMLLARYLDLCGGHRAISHGIGLKVQPKQDDLLQVLEPHLGSISRYREGVPLDTVFIHPLVIDMLDSAAEDAIKCGHLYVWATNVLLFD